MGDDAQKSWRKTLTTIRDLRRDKDALMIRDLWRDKDFAEYESQMQGALEGGDKGALLRFIGTCFDTGRAVPQWAQEEFQNAVYKVSRLQARSWDEVFGRPLKKGKQLSAKRKWAELPLKIWDRVGELHEAGVPISKPVFATVGKEFRVSASIAEEMYYSARKTILAYLTTPDPDLQRKIIALLTDSMNPGKI